MGLFQKRTTPKRNPKRNPRNKVTCPECGSSNLSLGYVDRVSCTVLHACESCGVRWRDDLIDLAEKTLAARTG